MTGSLAFPGLPVSFTLDRDAVHVSHILTLLTIPEVSPQILRKSLGGRVTIGGSS